jgi:micrococcal nuclease
MLDLYEITDTEIRDALDETLAHSLDAYDPETRVYVLDQLLPTVRGLLDRPRPGYTYRAVVREWVDADTVDLDIDLGLRQWVHDERIRLLGVNAPDRNPAKAKATAWVRDLAPAGAQLIVRTHKDETEKYGRLLGDLYLGDTHVNTAMIDAGHGQPYAGGKRPEDY